MSKSTEKIYHFTQQEMDDLLDRILDGVRRQVKKELAGGLEKKEEKKKEEKKKEEKKKEEKKKEEKKGKGEEKKLKRTNSAPNLKEAGKIDRKALNAMSAKDVEAKAQKKAKKEGRTIKATGRTKAPTKEDNIKFILGEQGKKKEEKKKKEASSSDNSDIEVHPSKKEKEKEKEKKQKQKEKKKEKEKKKKEESSDSSDSSEDISLNKKLGIYTGNGFAYTGAEMAFGRVLKTGKIIPLTGEEKKKLKKKGIDVANTCPEQKNVDRMIKEVKKAVKEDEGSSSSSSEAKGSSSSSGSSSSTTSFSSCSDASDDSDGEQNVPSDSGSD